MDEKPWSIIGLSANAIIFGVGVISGAFLRKLFSRGSSTGSVSVDTFQRAAKLTALRAQGLGRNHKMIFVVRTDLQMGKGKIAAQCCHAAVMCYQKAMVMDPENLDLWEATGTAKVCLKADGDEKNLKALEKLARDLKIVTAIVRDAGHTQVQGSCIIPSNIP